ncbi:hypothetical protein PsorP6_003607 [Peronosclerospora sorghi]|uniref:Uncharacterized protein n=1 Tax=Peronosclerospora sorghi TaxID=230839 RepID=A0ACC0VSC5_9STRA|nr:hypothetical protein PsorP6_003607 [Peronosclerospora sorghi]
MTTGTTGLSLFSVSSSSTRFTISKPSTTLPNTTCLPSRCGVGTVVMKNCDPFVPGPALAIDNKPASVCLSRKFSSGNFSP